MTWLAFFLTASGFASLGFVAGCMWATDGWRPQ